MASKKNSKKSKQRQSELEKEAGELNEEARDVEASEEAGKEQFARENP